MSRHSKNNTSQSIFTYGEKQKLKGQYGTIESRIGQDSIKKFQMCTICNHEFVDPVCCSKGHIFCRECAFEFMVNQRKKIKENLLQVQKNKIRQEMQQKHKELEQKAKKAVQFQKYDNFENLTQRAGFSVKEQKDQKAQEKVSAQQSKPVGVYEIILPKTKQKFVKSSFWAIQNTPSIQAGLKLSEVDETIKCAGSDHELTLKELRSLIVKKVENEYCCGVCNKQIRRQKIGSYRCGHIICTACKGQKCEVCGKKFRWIDIESSSSSFSQHNKAEVKTYKHAFYI